MRIKYYNMSFIFGSNSNNTSTETDTTNQPTHVHEINFNRLKRRKNFEDGNYRVTTKYGEYVGDIRNCEMNGQGRYTWRDGRFQEGLFKNNRLVSGTYKDSKRTLTGTFSEDVPDALDCSEGTIDFGNGITFKGFVQNNCPVENKGEYTVAPNTQVEFREWRGIRSGIMGTLTRDGEWWVQTYSTGPVKEVRSTSFNVYKMNASNYGNIRITFRDGCVYEGRLYGLSDNVNVNGRDRFTLGSNVNFSQWGNYQLDYWLVANRNLDHLPDMFFENVRMFNVTGAQMLKFTANEFRDLGLFSRVLQTQVMTELDQFRSN